MIIIVALLGVQVSDVLPSTTTAAALSDISIVVVLRVIPNSLVVQAVVVQDVFVVVQIVGAVILIGLCHLLTFPR